MTAVPPAERTTVRNDERIRFVRPRDERSSVCRYATKLAGRRRGIIAWLTVWTNWRIARDPHWWVWKRERWVRAVHSCQYRRDRRRLAISIDCRGQRYVWPGQGRPSDLAQRCDTAAGWLDLSNPLWWERGADISDSTIEEIERMHRSMKRVEVCCRARLAMVGNIAVHLQWQREHVGFPRSDLINQETRGVVSYLAESVVSVDPTSTIDRSAEQRCLAWAAAYDLVSPSVWNSTWSVRIACSAVVFEIDRKSSHRCCSGTTEQRKVFRTSRNDWHSRWVVSVYIAENRLGRRDWIKSIVSRPAKN